MRSAAGVPDVILAKAIREQRRREARRRGVASLFGVLVLPRITPKPQPPAEGALELITRIPPVGLLVNSASQDLAEILLARKQGRPPRRRT